MKVLILQQYLPHYRLPVFNEFASKPGISLTVAHSEAEPVANEGGHFKQLLLSMRSRLGFFFVKEDLVQLCNEYDVVISLFNLRIPQYWQLCLVRGRKYKFIFWGIGVTSLRGFDATSRLDWARYMLAKRADAVVFYSSYPIKKYTDHGVPAHKLFVAHNTVKLPSEFLSGPEHPKKSFFFLGTLYADKKVPELIEAFAAAWPKFKDPVHLHIVGDGDQRQLIEGQIKSLGLERHITMYGSINDPVVQKQFFSEAYACVSPGQAGLSVLQSMAFGVPFVTQSNAITGGERLNIIHDENGILYEGGSEALALILLRLVNDRPFHQKLCSQAYQYFTQHCTIERMISGYTDAIDYVFDHKQYD